MKYFLVELPECASGEKIASSILEVAKKIRLEAKLLEKLPAELPDNVPYDRTAILITGPKKMFRQSKATVIIPNKPDANFYHIGMDLLTSIPNEKYFELTKGVSKKLFWY